MDKLSEQNRALIKRLLPRTAGGHFFTISDRDFGAFLDAARSEGLPPPGEDSDRIAEEGLGDVDKDICIEVAKRVMEVL